MNLHIVSICVYIYQSIDLSSKYLCIQLCIYVSIYLSIIYLSFKIGFLFQQYFMYITFLSSSRLLLVCIYFDRVQQSQNVNRIYICVHFISNCFPLCTVIPQRFCTHLSEIKLMRFSIQNKDKTKKKKKKNFKQRVKASSKTNLNPCFLRNVFKTEGKLDISL